MVNSTKLLQLDGLIVSNQFKRTKSSNEAVCINDGGYNYKFNKWTSVSTSDYKPWKPKDDYEDFAPNDKVSHKYNTIRKQCFRNTCHVLPTFTTKMWKSHIVREKLGWI